MNTLALVQCQKINDSYNAEKVGLADTPFVLSVERADTGVDHFDDAYYLLDKSGYGSIIMHGYYANSFSENRTLFEEPYRNMLTSQVR